MKKQTSDLADSSLRHCRVDDTVAFVDFVYRRLNDQSSQQRLSMHLLRVPYQSISILSSLVQHATRTGELLASREVLNFYCESSYGSSHKIPSTR